MPAGSHSRRRPALNLCAVAVLASLLCGVLAASSIPLGSRLLPSDTPGWVSSPNETFRFSFFASSADPLRFSVGVLYNEPGINSTVAWTPQGPAQVDASGSFELSADGNLLLRDGAGAAVWNSSTAGVGVSSASIGDDGNFALLNSSGSTLWQSFQRPTDTLVANQRLLEGASLTAGDYTAILQASGNLSLIYTGNGGFTYWSSETSAANSSIYASLDAAKAAFSIYEESGAIIKSWYSNDYTTTTGQPIRRVTLDSDGNLRIYTTSAGNWVIGWEALQDYCQIYAYCGPYGLCGYNETSLVCKCASQAGYNLIDARNPRNGCTPIAGNGGQNCSAQYPARMIPGNHTMLFISDSQNRNFRYGDTECSQNCLLNVQCTAAMALGDGSGSCQLVLSNNFFSGTEELSSLTNTFFKFCGSNVPPASGASSSSNIPPAPVSGKGGSSLAVTVLVSVLATLVLLAMGQAIIWWIFCKRNPRWGGYSAQYALMEYASGAPVQFTYKELRKATGNFREKLGEGGFGVVYKGELSMTNSGGVVAEVAVKRLEGLAERGEKQFRMEVAVIGSTHHVNLVRLCGFCAEGNHRLLVYEYMKNGSLDKHLFVTAEGGEGGEHGRSQPPSVAVMDWETRYNVLLGTARGITYLHQECRDCIVHSDIKPENILLDDKFTAKVSDFGLAKLTRIAASRLNTNSHVTKFVRGTRGYLAPEWRSNLPITVKADVFSYGMVVLEAISGRKSSDVSMLSDTSSTSSSHLSFPEWAYHQFFIQNQVQGVVDARIKDDIDMEQLERAMKVAFWCVQLQPSSRPSMSRVVQMLDGSMQDTQTPPMPKFYRDRTMSPISTEVSSDLATSFTQERSNMRSYDNSSYATSTSYPSPHPENHMSQSVLGQRVLSPPPARKYSSLGF